MYEGETASSRWSTLDTDRQSFIRRCEKYSAFTIPKICRENGSNQGNDELQHDYQSLGAQAVNHLSNKLMLALFAPSRPFFRLDPTKDMKAEVQEAGAEQEIAAELAIVEADAVKELDRRAIRPKMYDAMKHIIVTGNGLLVLGEKGAIRILGIKNYVVKRGIDGEVLDLVTKETVPVRSLEKDVVAYLTNEPSVDVSDPKTKVEMYKWVCKDDNGEYRLTTWINDCKLDSKYEGKWSADECPYRAITWDLAAGDDYGTGLVEDYAGDFAALSMMSQATVQAALLASEFRWLANPAGMTSPKDFEESANGAVLPGVKGDLELVQAGKGMDLQININIAQQYITRIGQGFLLHSAVTRQAERVTAEEVRMTAEELETSLGGAYSRIAVDIQVPMAYWLMDLSGKKIKGTSLKPTIVTGLAALSRSGDRDNLVLFLQDCTLLGSLPPEMRARMKVGAVQAAFAAARGLPATNYLLTDDEFAVVQQRMQAEAQQAQAAQLGAEVGAHAAIKGA